MFGYVGYVLKHFGPPAPSLRPLFVLQFVAFCNIPALLSAWEAQQNHEIQQTPHVEGHLCIPQVYIHLFRSIHPKQTPSLHSSDLQPAA